MYFYYLSKYCPNPVKVLLTSVKVLSNPLKGLYLKALRSRKLFKLCKYKNKDHY